LLEVYFNVFIFSISLKAVSAASPEQSLQHSLKGQMLSSYLSIESSNRTEVGAHLF